VAVVCTHGVFPDDSLDRIRASGLVEHVVCTDSHPRAVALRSDYLTVVSCAELLYPHLVVA
jgi:ribose-phosphate pyrophosphokinase